MFAALLFIMYNYIEKNIIQTIEQGHVINWSCVSLDGNLSEDFIRKFQDKVNWTYITRYQKLSESFIEEFQDKIDWRYISYYQILSENFIRKFSDKLILSKDKIPFCCFGIINECSWRAFL